MIKINYLSKFNLNKIYYLRKQAVQAITNSDYQAHSTPLFSNQRILDIFQVNMFEIAKFMFNFKNNLLPPLLLNLFVTNSQIHNRVPEQPVIIKHIKISSNLQFSIKVLKFGTLFLFQSLTCQTYFSCKIKMQEFLLK